MGEVILGSLADSVLGHLTSLISNEIGQACGVKTELRKLQGTFSAIKAVLSEAERRQIEEKDVKHWLEQLSVSVYDVEDLLDDFSTEALRRGAMGGNRILKEVRIFFSSSNRLFYSFRMAHQIKDMRETLDAINEDKSKYSLNQYSVGNPASSGRVLFLDRNLLEKRNQRDDTPFLCKSYVYGRVEDKREICHFLLDPTLDENISTIAIVGIGGMGKTTLAKLVYDDQSVQDHFELKLWVCVSVNFDVEAIVKKLVHKCDSNRKPEDCIKDELPKKLDGKRFLIVLDDVWNENRPEWLNLKGFFEKGARGSKILVTTRNTDVVNTMKPVRVHPLKGLPEDEALSLLKLMAAKPEHEWNVQGLEAIGREIVTKCRGVPLAVATIGGLLCLKDAKDWPDFCSRDLAKVEQVNGGILQTLKLSYDILPSHLKQCFIYCSLFPKDYYLDPNELIHLWMAQGFIRSLDSTRTLEDVGWDCFKELAGRFFFQDLEEDEFGNIVTCKMHDLMHDLAQSVAANNFVIVDGSNARDSCVEEARHLSLLYTKDFEWKGEVFNKIRSFLFLQGYNLANPLDKVTSGFKSIRVLCLAWANLDVVPKWIGKLKHLRSLDLRGNWKIQALPPSISKLHNLETLNLRGCSSLTELPRGITKLINLRQLEISGCHKLTHMPKGIEKLTNLQMLSDFVVGEKGNSNAAGLDELNRLKGLKKRLAIRYLGRVEDTLHQSITPFFVKNSRIKVLGLDWKRDGEVEQSEETEDFEERQANQEAILERLQPHSNLMGLELCNYSGRTFSSWVSQWHNLVHLVIRGCYFCKSLPPIHQFPSLKSLKLKKLNTYYIEVEERGNQNSVFFPSLESILFKDLPNFKGWRWMHGGNDDNDDIMIPLFPKGIQCETRGCPNFSYTTHELLSLANVTEKLVQQFVRNGKGQTPPPKEEVMAATAPSFIFMSFVPTIAWKSLCIKNPVTNALLEELFHSLSLTSLQRLQIMDAPHLKSLPLRAILGHLPALEYLEIDNCPELDLSTSSVLEEEADVQLNHGHINSRIREVCIGGVVLMNCLPWWFQHLSGLEILIISKCSGLQDLTRLMCCPTSLKKLTIDSCGGLKSLSRRVILHLLSTLEELEIKFCPELDLNGDQDEEDDKVNLQFVNESPLRELYIIQSKAESLPWWIEHLNNLETLSILICQNLKALPEWFTKLASLGWLYIQFCPLLKERCRKNGPDWPKISRIQSISLDDEIIQQGNGD